MISPKARCNYCGKFAERRILGNSARNEAHRPPLPAFEAGFSAALPSGSRQDEKPLFVTCPGLRATPPYSKQRGNSTRTRGIACRFAANSPCCHGGIDDFTQAGVDPLPLPATGRASCFPVFWRKAGGSAQAEGIARRFPRLARGFITLPIRQQAALAILCLPRFLRQAEPCTFPSIRRKAGGSARAGTRCPSLPAADPGLPATLPSSDRRCRQFRAGQSASPAASRVWTGIFYRPVHPAAGRYRKLRAKQA